MAPKLTSEEYGWFSTKKLPPQVIAKCRTLEPP
jgi:hypothetical protein